jgi:hypothetical protein
MRASHRVALAACAAVVLAVSLGVSWYLLPGPKGCPGPVPFVPSGPFGTFHCDSGALNVFGAGLFTLWFFVYEGNTIASVNADHSTGEVETNGEREDDVEVIFSEFFGL